MHIRCLNVMMIFPEDLKKKASVNGSYWIKVQASFVISLIIISHKITKDQFRASEVYPEVIKIKRLHNSRIIYEKKTIKRKFNPKVINR